THIPLLPEMLPAATKDRVVQTSTARQKFALNCAIVCNAQRKRMPKLFLELQINGSEVATNRQLRNLNGWLESGFAEQRQAIVMRWPSCVISFALRPDLRRKPNPNFCADAQHGWRNVFVPGRPPGVAGLSTMENNCLAMFACSCLRKSQIRFTTNRSVMLT